MYTLMTVIKVVCGLLLFYSPVVYMYLLLPCKIFGRSAICLHDILVSLMILTRGMRQMIKSKKKNSLAWLMERLGDLRVGNHLEAVDVCGMIILKWIFKKWNKGHGLD